MINNILVPDCSLQQPSYVPLYLRNDFDLHNYLVAIGINPMLYREAVIELIKSGGILTLNIINYLRYRTSLMFYPSAPLGEFDDQRNFNSFECPFFVGTLQTK